MKYDTPYDPTNRGALFKAGYKKTDKSPDYLGSLNVEGKEWAIFGRRATAAKSGKVYIQLTVAPPLPKEEAPPVKARQAKEALDDPFDDDPF